MMRSLYSGVSGLRVHQTKMDVIGNNIANVNTTAFKSSRVTFNEIFSQTLQGASGGSENKGGQNPMQVGLGVNIASIDVLMTEGAAQRTDNPLDIKIEGEGFFIVTDGNGYKFTRDGSFKVDLQGNLVTSSGYMVCGWKMDETTGDIVKGPVEPLKVMTAETYNVKPEKTTSVTYEKNLKIADGDPTGSGIPIISNFFDSLGNKYTMQMTAYYYADDTHPDAPAGVPCWAINQIDSIKDAQGKEVGDASDPGNPLAGNLTGFPLEIHFDTEGNQIPALTVDIDFGSATPIEGIEAEVGRGAGLLQLDFSGVTQYNSSTTVTSKMTDGRAAGTFSGYSIGADGKIVIKYSNGETKTLGQISLATFTNPSGLQKAGGNLFETTINSGEFDGIGVDPLSVGTLNGGVLEMSNVDLSREFTDMITTQRGFQANSRIITVSDTLLEELTNLKR